MSDNASRRNFLGRLLGAGSAAVAAGLPAPAQARQAASELAVQDREQPPAGVAGHILLTGNFRVPCAAVIEEESHQLWQALYRIEDGKVFSRELDHHHKKKLPSVDAAGRFSDLTLRDAWSEPSVARRESLYSSLDEYMAQGWEILSATLTDYGFKAPALSEGRTGRSCQHFNPDDGWVSLDDGLRALHALRLPSHLSRCGVYRWPYVEGPKTQTGGQRCIGYTGDLGFAVLALAPRVLATPQEVLRGLQERLGTLQLLDARADVWCDLQHTATTGRAHA